MVFFLPVMAYVAAAGSTRALATAPPRGRLVLDGVVIALALVAVATYVSPWGIAAARALLAD